MQDFGTTTSLDMLALEVKARQMRADATRDVFKALGVWLRTRFHSGAQTA